MNEPGRALVSPYEASDRSALIGEAEAAFSANGWYVHMVDDAAGAHARVLDIVGQGKAVVVRVGPYWSPLALEESLTAVGRLTLCGPGQETPARATLMTADVGITGASALVLETATALLAADDAYGQLVSDLPYTHVVVAEAFKLVRTLGEGLALVRRWSEACLGRPVPHYIGGVSGPSRTGDIEMTIVQGMHGPGKVHLVLLCGAIADSISAELLAT